MTGITNGHGRRKEEAKASVRVWMGMHSDTVGEVAWHGKHRSIGMGDKTSQDGCDFLGAMYGS